MNPDRLQDTAVEFLVHNKMRQATGCKQPDARRLWKACERRKQSGSQLNAAFWHDRVGRVIGIDQYWNNRNGALGEISAVNIRERVALMLIGPNLLDCTNVEAAIR